MLISPGCISLTYCRRGSIEVTVFKSHVELVLHLVASGLLGDGVGGSDEHLKALADVELKCAEVRHNILAAPDQSLREFIASRPACAP
jgi:hypothetical protein